MRLRFRFCFRQNERQLVKHSRAKKGGRGSEGGIRAFLVASPITRFGGGGTRSLERHGTTAATNGGRLPLTGSRHRPAQVRFERVAFSPASYAASHCVARLPGTRGKHTRPLSMSGSCLKVATLPVAGSARPTGRGHRIADDAGENVAASARRLAGGHAEDAMEFTQRLCRRCLEDRRTSLTRSMVPLTSSIAPRSTREKRNA